MVRAVVGGRMSTAMSTTVALLAMAGGGSGASPMRLGRMSRKHLPLLCRDLGFTKGAEIGVWRGEYSALFCEANHAMHMLCVDPWISYPEWNDPKNLQPLKKSDALIAGAYQDARDRLSPLNATLLRQFSVEAAKGIPDGSLDVIYIDGNHVEDAVRADLEAWAPKVRSGGIVAGHDFKVFPTKPMIQVIPAVEGYTRDHAIEPWFVLAADKTPSYLWVKA